MCWFYSAAPAISPSWCTTWHEMTALTIHAPEHPDAEQIITPESVQFLELLARHFGPRRKALLQRRREVQECLRSGALPDFLEETREIRERSWTVGPAPADLNDRRGGSTGPGGREKMIKSLDSRGEGFMGDFPDGL